MHLAECATARMIGGYWCWGVAAVALSDGVALEEASHQARVRGAMIRSVDQGPDSRTRHTTDFTQASQKILF